MTLGISFMLIYGYIETIRIKLNLLYNFLCRSVSIKFHPNQLNCFQVEIRGWKNRHGPVPHRAYVAFILRTLTTEHIINVFCYQAYTFQWLLFCNYFINK
jgi:hypothetical protein